MSDTEPKGEAKKSDNMHSKKPLSLEDRKAKLLEKHKTEMANLNRQIKAKDAREVKKQKKLEDHYKIIEGALSRKNRLANPNSQHAKEMNRLFDESVIKDDARIYFGLKPLPEKEKIERIAQQRANRKKNKEIESF